MSSLETFNALPAELARRQLLACCASDRWAEEIASGRSYASPQEVLARSDASVAGLTQADLEQALAGHPRIGSAGADARSQREQAGVQAADQATFQALADGNEAYERRFGHIYLVCAPGRNAADLLALLHQRLDHDPATEWEVVRTELAQINQLRLRTFLEAPGEREAQ
jgi:2-oxo-4-hydroxy-4-carboxy-5-ureidoimidazoline decarboxylase